MNNINFFLINSRADNAKSAAGGCTAKCLSELYKLFGSFEDIYSDEEIVADLLVSDLSFISLEKVLPNLKLLMNKDFHEMICLIKPQFEAGKELVEKDNLMSF